MVALAALLVFVIVLITDVFVLKARKKSHPALIKNYKIVDVDLFNREGIAIPVDTYISKAHTYAEFVDDGIVKIGVDEFVSASLGTVLVTKIADKGKNIFVGDVILEGAAGGNKIMFYSPVAGVVKAVNDNLIGKNITDPYGSDWGVMIAPLYFDKSRSRLKMNDDLAEWMKEELKRFKEYIISSQKTEPAGATMYDGGTIIKGAAAQLNSKLVEQFQKEFLTV